MSLEVVPVSLDSAAVAPMLRQLAEDYLHRYGSAAELDRYSTADFAPPDGVLLVLRDGGRTVAGGAFRRYDDSTAEIKRMWTHTAHRRRGLARRVLAELERRAGAQCYRRLYLTTGWRQPEAKALYLAAGYTRLPDPSPDRSGVPLLAFEKSLPAFEKSPHPPKVER